MTRWSREPYLLVLACIGAALVVFVLGVSVVLAAGHSVPVALWAVGGAAVGILAGVLLPRSGSADGTSDSPTPEDPTPPDEDGEQPLVAGSADTEGEDDAGASPTEQGAEHAAAQGAEQAAEQRADPRTASPSEGQEATQEATPPPPTQEVASPAVEPEAAPPRRTPWLVVVLATTAVVGLALGGLLYGGLIHPAECELRGAARTPACDGPLLNFADVLIFIAAGAGGTLLGLYVRRPAPAPALVETPPPTPTPTPPVVPPPPPPPPNGPEPPPPPPGGTRYGLPAVLAAVALLVVLGAVALLLSLLPRATVDGARVFNVVSLLLIVAAGGLTVAAFRAPEGKRQGLVAGAVLTAVLAFVSSTASGFVLDRFAKPTAGPAPAITVKNDFSPIVKPPMVNVAVKAPNVRVAMSSDCAVYLENLDALVDDEPHIADRLPGRSFPLDQGARACGLKLPSEVDEIAAVLAAR